MRPTTAIRYTLLWIVLAGMTGCRAGGSGSGEDSPAPWAVMPKAPELSVQLKSDFTPVGATKLSEVYSVDIQVSALGINVPNDVEMIFRAPSGSIFERRRESFIGSPFDTQQKVMSLAVAGTVVETDTVSGLWTAQFLVNGVDVASTQFELSP